MSEFRLQSVQCLSPTGLHNVVYKEWGDPKNSKVLLCMHGVTRVSDDFDALAVALCSEYRVICPDVVGRGRSDRLLAPQYYHVPQYVSDMVTLLARIHVETLHWFGTSMGGLVGMSLASLKNSPIKKLVLNDIGPVLNPPALKRIGEYIGQAVRFADFDEALRYIRDISKPFGPHSEAEWRKMAADVLRRDEEGHWVRHYDLGLAEPFKTMSDESIAKGEKLLWHTYDTIQCPTLLVRGAESDLLSSDTAIEMTRRGPRAGLVTIAGVGHAPTFMHADQIDIARRFLLEEQK